MGLEPVFATRGYADLPALAAAVWHPSRGTRLPDESTGACLLYRLTVEKEMAAWTSFKGVMDAEENDETVVFNSCNKAVECPIVPEGKKRALDEIAVDKPKVKKSRVESPPYTLPTVGRYEIERRKKAVPKLLGNWSPALASRTRPTT